MCWRSKTKKRWKSILKKKKNSVKIDDTLWVPYTWKIRKTRFRIVCVFGACERHFVYKSAEYHSVGMFTRRRCNTQKRYFTLEFSAKRPLLTITMNQNWYSGNWCVLGCVFFFTLFLGNNNYTSPLKAFLLNRYATATCTIHSYCIVRDLLERSTDGFINWLYRCSQHRRSVQYNHTQCPRRLAQRDSNLYVMQIFFTSTANSK